MFIIMIVYPVAALADEDEKNALDYLPSSNFISGWEATGNEFIARPVRAGYLIADDIPLLMEFDCLWYATETYSLGNDEMTIEIFEFSSGSDAFGYYTLSYLNTGYVHPDDAVEVKPYDPPPFAEIDTLRHNVFMGIEKFEAYKDRFYFRISVTEENLPQSGIRAGLYLLARLPGTASPSNMIGILPVDNLVRGTERYIRGPVGLGYILGAQEDDLFGFDEYEWKAVAGEYRLGGGEYYLRIIAEYEDYETCNAVESQLIDYFQDNGWETVIYACPLSSIRPIAFRDDFYIAFWSSGTNLTLIWDLTDMEALDSAVMQPRG